MCADIVLILPWSQLSSDQSASLPILSSLHKHRKAKREEIDATEREVDIHKLRKNEVEISEEQR